MLKKVFLLYFLLFIVAKLGVQNERLQSLHLLALIVKVPDWITNCKN
jgi:hypothetical protein